MKKLYSILMLTIALILTFLNSCKVPVSSVHLNKTTLQLHIGSNDTLIATIYPSDASNATVKWSSSNPNVALVSDGIVSAKMLGTSTITATSKDGKHNATCEVTVVSAEPEMILVEGGTFIMGCTDDECSSDGREEPAHQVTVTGFKIGKYEVTQKQWKAVMGSNPSYSKGDNLPVEQISWHEVQTFITKLNEFTGKNYRLPTEAEWEFAARGGNKSQQYKYCGSNNINEVGWYDLNSGFRSHNVGEKIPNELGIYDMSGNVWEWCSDWFGEYTENAQTNPTGPISGTRKVRRSGGFNNPHYGLRVSQRGSELSSTVFWTLGFRLVLPL